MPTEQELEETYSQWSTEDLLYLISNKSDYTETAMLLALRELRKRKVPPDVINKVPVHEDGYKKLWMAKCLIDLNPGIKALIYFLSPLVLFVNMLRRDFGIQNPLSETYRRQGFLLRVHQSNYYTVTGISFVLAATIYASNSPFEYRSGRFFLSWLAGFGIAYLFDVAFNRKRLSDRLTKYKQNGELPWGV